MKVTVLRRELSFVYYHPVVTWLEIKLTKRWKIVSTNEKDTLYLEYEYKEPDTWERVKDFIPTFGILKKLVKGKMVKKFLHEDDIKYRIEYDIQECK